MAPDLEPGKVPLNRARIIQGFLGGRLGVMRSSLPLVRLLASFGRTPITGFAYYGNPRPPTEAEFAAGSYRLDQLLVVRESTHVYTHNLTFDATTGDVDVDAPTYIGELPAPKTGGLAGNLNMRSVQYWDELYMVAGDGSMPARFYVDSGGVGHLFLLGIQTPDAPTSAAGTAGLLTGDYQYSVCDVDDKGRESSPSALADVLTLSSQKGVVTYDWQADTQVVAKHIYRNLAGDTGTSVSYRIAEVTNRAVTTYTDNNADIDVTGNALCPLPGANDPPKRASCIEIHKTRLFLNDRSIYDDATYPQSVTRLQMSNLEGMSQFNQVAEPDDLALGVTQRIGNLDTDELTGLKSFGSLLGIWTRRGIYALYGDDFRDWTIRRQEGGVGCVAIDSLVDTGEGLMAYQGADGIYFMTYGDGGFNSARSSLEIDSLLRAPAQVART